MKLISILPAAMTAMAAMSLAAHATPTYPTSLTFDLSYILNDTYGAATVTGDVVFSEVNSGDTYTVQKVDINPFALPISNSNTIQVPELTYSGANVGNSGNFTIQSVSGVETVTTQGDASGYSITPAGSPYSYSIALSSSNKSSDFGYLSNASKTGNTFFATGKVTYTAVAAPEPSSYLLSVLALGAFGFLARRQAARA